MSEQPQPIETAQPVVPAPAPRKKSKIGLIIAAVVVVLLLAGGWGGYTYYMNLNGPCGTQRVSDGIDKLMLIANRWDDANKLANSTPRMALASPLASLQSIKQDAQNAELPACMQYAQNDLVQMMDHTITGYIKFMGQDTDAAVSSQFDLASSNQKNFVNDLAAVRQCAPNCGK